MSNPEIWEVVPDHDRFAVSTYGTIILRNTSNAVAQSNRGSGYRGVWIDKHKMAVHRVLGSAFIPNPDGLPCMDHKNGLRDDNRLENLRYVTISQNSMNRIGKPGTYKGVHCRRGRWRARIKIGGRRITLGVFDTAREAAAAYNNAAQANFGEFARLNVLYTEPETRA
jgi:hypothetical protein